MSADFPLRKSAFFAVLKDYVVSFSAIIPNSEPREPILVSTSSLAGPPPPLVPTTPLDYTIGAPIDGYRGLVQRASVLYPLMKHGPIEHLPSKVCALHTRWRGCVTALGERQWPGLRARNSSRYGRMLNCCPAFAAVHPATQFLIPCQFRTFCPFCWARYAGDRWAELDRTLYCSVSDDPGRFCAT
jgi:hypothetical protein